MPLTARQIDTAKPKDKSYKLADSGGLFLSVSVTGSKSWRMKYRINGKEKLLTIGLYPAITLADARKAREAAKELLAKGIDPSQKKKSDRIESLIAADDTFKAIAIEWYESKKNVWSPKYGDEILRMFESDIFPFIGGMPITEIKPLMLLDVLRRFEKRGALERGSKARRRCGEVFRYAVVTGRTAYNPAPDLASAMTANQSEHYPFLQGDEIKAFNEALASYSGNILSKIATQLLELTGLRTVELRMTEWSFINFEEKTWEIPKEIMKRRKPHLVPMSRQVIALLKQLQPISGAGRFILPGRSDRSKPISENTILGVIRRIGFDGRASGHGFRHQMSTILNENKFPADYIERQLAHVSKDKIRGIYNHAQWLPERAEMMQWYADYLDLL